jgi:hypothetical protein
MIAPGPLTVQLVELFCADCYADGLPATKSADELISEFRGWLAANEGEPTLCDVLGAGQDDPAGVPVPDVYA